MTYNIKTTTPKAAKDYRCEGFNAVRDEFGDTGEDENGPILSQTCEGVIKKGQVHHMETNRDDYQIWNWRCCFKCMKLVKKYRLWDE